MIYRCLRGDCDNLALLEPDCFALRDARGRGWLCYERPGEELTADELPESVAQLCELQARLHRAGQSQAGTAMQTMVCDNREELAQRLAGDRGGPRVFLCVTGPAVALLEEEPGAISLTDGDGCRWSCIDCGPAATGGWQRQGELGWRVLRAGMHLPYDEFRRLVLVGVRASDLDELKTQLSAGQPLDS